MKIYVASSWRNIRQPSVVAALRGAGHDVYDFRYPWENTHGFSWSVIDPNWKNWSTEEFIEALKHKVAVGGFELDWGAMQWADACVLVMPCGRSAHLEAGYFVGAKKTLYILIEKAAEPELMYKMATRVCGSLDDVVESINSEKLLGS